MASKRQIFVGGVPIGGGAPVVVQTMTKTETANLAATMEQIRKVADAGADIVRCAVPREQDAEALKTIVKESPIPVIADIHFNHTLALKAIDAGAHCIRLNPGNIGGREKVAEVAVKANEHTGLTSPDVFAFGNLIGDADGSGRVNSLDLGAVKALLNTAAPISSRVDFNRDGRVNALDLGIAKKHLNRTLVPSALPLPTAPAPTPAAEGVAASLLDGPQARPWEVARSISSIEG